MENHKRISCVDEIQLPQEIILHIQSFMSEKEAARTTLLSKSWYNAWSTRPRLTFNRYDFDMWDDGPFIEFTVKTMQKYEDSNLKIESFRLQTITLSFDDNSVKLLLAKELILRAIKLGATDIEIVIPSAHSPLFLPGEVLESKTLTRLSLTGFRVDVTRSAVACSNLKSLTLHHMIVYGELFRDFILRCPLIEELTLDDIMHVKKDEWDPLNRVADDGGTIKSDKIHNLKYLCLEYDHFERYKDSIFLSRDGYLECVFPLLLKDVHIHIPCYEPTATDGYITSWFAMLRKLMTMLSHYRAYLTIDVERPIKTECDDVYRYYEAMGSLIPTLETLTINGHMINKTFIRTLLQICRPKKTIIQEYVKMECKRVDVKLLEERFSKRRYLPWIKEMDTSVRNRFLRFQLRWN